MPRPTWQGNIEAQRLADAAAATLKPKNKKRRRKRKHGPGEKIGLKRRERKGARLRYYSQMAYDDYLQTNWWRKRRKRALRRAKHRCEQCGEHKRLSVHHLNYKRLGSEKQRDLMVLCNRCHDAEHFNDPSWIWKQMVASGAFS